MITKVLLYFSPQETSLVPKTACSPGVYIFLLGCDPQYSPPMGEKWRAAMGSIRSGVYKNIDPRLFL
jgi:hypothetical protein